MRHFFTILAFLATVVGTLVLGAQPADATGQCIRIIRQGDIETLVNRCDTCRVASLIRSRPGSEVPAGRKFNVQGNSTFPVPFRGPGRTRITSDFPCPGEAGGDTDLLSQETAEQAADPTCVSLERADRIGVVLVNRCGTCRAVAIERVTADGSGRARDYMTLVGGTRTPVTANGFAAIGLLGELPCPK